MSWSDRARPVAALALSLALAGCFQPLYGESSHPGLTEKLRQVQVTPIPDRIGHYLADDLISRFNGTGTTVEPKYRLDIKLAKNATSPIVESQFGISTSSTLATDASFSLTQIDKGTVIYSGLATAAAPYDTSLQSYANLRAARDAEIRDARSLAQEIEVRVAAALSAAN